MENQINTIYQKGIFLYNDSKLSQLLDDLQLKAWCSKRNSEHQFEVIVEASETDFVFLDRLFADVAQAIDSCTICHPNHFQSIHELVQHLDIEQKIQIKGYFTFIIPCEQVTQTEYSLHIRKRRDEDLELEFSFNNFNDNPVFKQFVLSLFTDS